MIEIKSELDIKPSNNAKISKNRKKLERKKKAKHRKKLEYSKKECIETNEIVEYPTKLNDIEVFELTGGFERFKFIEINDEDDNSNDENKDKVVSKLPDNLPKKAVAAAILQAEEEDEDKPISRKQWKRMNRLTVGQLKVKVKDPRLVEPYDNCSPDPLFLLELKRSRNTVPVPAHWCYKGRYLQGKRGFYKPPFKLPDYIANTGIMDIRPTNVDDNRTLKSKMKEKMKPRVGAFDLNYGKLYQAFFELQTKPKYSILGDIYYQGKELESECKFMRPGYLSDILREALGMPPNNPPSNAKIAPPFLIHQQRYGPPPSWPKLKIPGLNAQLPPGASYGYHKDGWGKPPVDENNVPLYGKEVFENFFVTFADKYKYADDEEEEEQKKLWGEFDSDDEDDGEEKEEGDSDDEEEEEPLPTEPIVARREIEEGEVSEEEEDDSEVYQSRHSRNAQSLPSQSADVEVARPSALPSSYQDHQHNTSTASTPTSKSLRPRRPYLELKSKPVEKDEKPIMGTRMIYDIDGFDSQSGGNADVRKDVTGNESVDSASIISGNDSTSLKRKQKSDNPASVKAKKHKSFKF